MVTSAVTIARWPVRNLDTVRTSVIETFIQIAAVAVSVWSAWYAGSWGWKIHRENVESSTRNLELVERQLRIEEDQHRLARLKETIPSLVLHTNSDGVPCISNVGEAAAMHVVLDFATDPGPSGSFSLFSTNVFMPNKEVPLTELSDGIDDERMGTVKVFSKGPTGAAGFSRQKFFCRMTPEGNTWWEFPEFEDDGKVRFEAASGSWVNVNDQVYFQMGSEPEADRTG